MPNEPVKNIETDKQHWTFVEEAINKYINYDIWELVSISNNLLEKFKDGEIVDWTRI